MLSYLYGWAQIDSFIIRPVDDLLVDTSDYFKTTANLEIAGLLAGKGGSFIPASYNGPKARVTTSPPGYFQATLSLDRKLHPHLFLGGGFGFSLSRSSILPRSERDWSAMVLGYMDIRYYFLTGKHTPYLAAQTGASMYAYYKTFGGGAMFGVQFGGRFTIARRVGMLLFAGYRMQHIAVNGDLDYLDRDTNRRYTASGLIQTVFNFLHVGGGFSF